MFFVLFLWVGANILLALPILNSSHELTKWWLTCIHAVGCCWRDGIWMLCKLWLVELSSCQFKCLVVLSRWWHCGTELLKYCSDLVITLLLWMFGLWVVSLLRWWIRSHYSLEIPRLMNFSRYSGLLFSSACNSNILYVQTMSALMLYHDLHLLEVVIIFFWRCYQLASFDYE